MQSKYQVITSRELSAGLAEGGMEHPMKLSEWGFVSLS